MATHSKGSSVKLTVYMKCYVHYTRVIMIDQKYAFSSSFYEIDQHMMQNKLIPTHVAYIHACTHTHRHTRIYTQTHTHVECTHTCTHTKTCTHRHTHRDTQIHTLTYIQIQIHMYTCMHVSIRMYTHTHSICTHNYNIPHTGGGSLHVVFNWQLTLLCLTILYP